MGKPDQKAGLQRVLTTKVTNLLRQGYGGHEFHKRLKAWAMLIDVHAPRMIRRMLWIPDVIFFVSFVTFVV